MPAQRNKSQYQKDKELRHEDRIQTTLNDITTGTHVSFRSATKASGLPLSTLTDRAKGRHQSQHVAAAKKQRLTPEQEIVLVLWIKKQAAEGQALTRLNIRERAEEISGKEVGRKWLELFLVKHPELALTKPSRLDPKRAKNFNPAVMNDYFEKLEELHAEFDGIPPEHIWNMDEKGIQMGGGRKNNGKKYCFPKLLWTKYIMRNDSLELVTVLECVSAGGEVIPPSFCLQSGSVPDLRDLGDDDWGSIYFSENGWTDTDNYRQWLKEVFIPFAVARHVDCTKLIVLAVDGHSTHEHLDVKRVIYKFLDDQDIKIRTLCFPLKTTHKMQPLDVKIFASVDRQWQNVCADSAMKGIQIDQHSVIPLYIQATREVFTDKLIKSAFKSTGLYPVNRNVFTPEDFAPSQASSIVVHVPETFPTFPSSDPADSSDMDEDWLPPSSDVASCSSSDSEDACDNDINENNIDENLDADEGSDQSDNADSTHSISGFMSALASLESEVIHRTRSRTVYCNLIASRPPKIVSLEEDLALSPEECFSALWSVWEQLLATQDLLGQLFSHNLAANAHCVSMRKELEFGKVQMENTKKSKERGSKKIKARFVTSRGLCTDFDQEDEEQRQKEKAAKEKQAQNEEHECHVEREAHTRVFTGRLSSYKKDDLQALAKALTIPDKGTNSELLSKIMEHFDQHPELQGNSRYSGLFDKPTRSYKGKGVTHAGPGKEQLNGQSNHNDL